MWLLPLFDAMVVPSPRIAPMGKQDAALVRQRLLASQNLLDFFLVGAMNNGSSHIRLLILIFSTQSCMKLLISIKFVISIAFVSFALTAF